MNPTTNQKALDMRIPTLHFVCSCAQTRSFGENPHSNTVANQQTKHARARIKNFIVPVPKLCSCSIWLHLAGFESPSHSEADPEGSLELIATTKCIPSELSSRRIAGQSVKNRLVWKITLANILLTQCRQQPVMGIVEDFGLLVGHHLNRCSFFQKH